MPKTTLRRIIDQNRAVLAKLAGVGRTVVDVCSDCQHEIDTWDIEMGEPHHCPPRVDR